MLNPYICLPRPIHNSGWGIEPQYKARIVLEKDATASSSEYINQINEPEDLERIRMPRLTLDAAKEEEIIREADMLFDGIIGYRMTGMCLHMGIWDTISMWMGVTNCYIELLDRPEMIHSMMDRGMSN